MKKRIILGLPTIYGLGSLLKENLEYLGFEVIDISFDYKGFRYKNLSQRIFNFFHKVFLKDRSYKDKLRFEAHQAEIMEKLADLKPKADYALIIRPDTYSKAVLESIKEKAVVMAGYQWDGLDRYPWAEKRIPMFDRFFVFDPMDVQGGAPVRRYLGNFYFTLPRVFETPVTQKAGAYFVGDYSRERVQFLQSLQPLLAGANMLPDFNLFSGKKRRLKQAVPGLKLSAAAISYEQNLEKVKKASVLIDITAPCHKGLSLRFFEAICYEKKIITNNSSVASYDFYHPDNIFIYGVDDLSGLTRFLEKPYKALPQEISRKYAFTNWIRYVLDMAPYTPISAPQSAVLSACSALKSVHFSSKKELECHATGNPVASVHHG
ncbi:hypothetical protein SAMN05192529_101277 [Arachidicoccus rhizosphaerae]|uniref:Uncharacterized protein n=1 Tax=Arachidicoccus rhizosphaerae TaxID=551991 RepID=A0A1H3VP33_9BACT|nr:hypothetical protein [Arachidicoccus rhizosphaerae]SDZ75878.1 hypothetical protein SAMN05192529_101277 [Arachidicoccus rhizosphaerae]